MDFDYKKYSLEQLENWVHDAVSSTEASPQEIYDVIKGVVEEQYHYFKHHTGHCYELLALLNGNGKGHIEAYDDYVKEVLSEREYYGGKDDGMRPWGHSDLEYQIANKKEDKVKKWVLPVEVSDDLEDYIVTFPNDLLEAANLKEGDRVEWVDQKDGSYLLKKVQPTHTSHADMIANGYTMTDDGFWIRE